MVVFLSSHGIFCRVDGAEIEDTIATAHQKQPIKIIDVFYASRFRHQSKSIQIFFSKTKFLIKLFLCSHRGVRPFGVSLLICGWDNDRPYLFQCDPSVSIR